MEIIYKTGFLPHRFYFSSLRTFLAQSIILMENFVALVVKVQSRKLFLQQYFKYIRSRRVLSRPGIRENEK